MDSSYCPLCGTPVLPLLNFCPHCGIWGPPSDDDDDDDADPGGLGLDVDWMFDF